VTDLLADSSASVGSRFSPHLDPFSSGASIPRERVWRIRPPVVRVPEALTHRPWFDAIIVRCRELLALAEGWDSYGGQSVNVKTVEQLLMLLAGLPVTDAPSIVPLHDGGLQMEWHSARGDVEIEVRPHGAVSVLIETPEREEEWPLLSPLDVHQLRLESLLGS